LPTATGEACAPGRLTAVFPIVIYNADPAWAACRDVADLIEPLPGGLTAYRPSLRYHLLDEGRVQTLAADNTVADLMEIAYADGEQNLRLRVGARRPPVGCGGKRLNGTWRATYRHMAMNPAMQAMFAIPDLTGQSIRDNFPDEVEAWDHDHDQVLDTGQPVCILSSRNCRRDNSLRRKSQVQRPGAIGSQPDAVSAISTSAGIPRLRCKRRIMASVSGRLWLRTS
jgi:PAS domain-containing protein